MTPEQPESTCFDATEPLSTEWGDVSELGRAIISQLRIDDYDTLSRWLAYRLAELLDQARSDDSSKDSATDLILRIWRARWDWPRGWPPAMLKSRLAWLFRPAQPPWRGNTGSKEELMHTVTDELKKEYRFWLRFVSDSGFELTPQEEIMLAEESSPERGIMQWLIDPDGPSEHHKESLEPEDELDSILESRRTLLGKMLEAADSHASFAGTMTEDPLGRQPDSEK